MADPRVRQLTIKTGVVRRLTKEKIVYEKEVDTQKNRIEKVKNAGEDEHVVRKQEEVLAECLMMIPDCRRRLGKAVEELKEFLSNETDLGELEQFRTAKAVVDEAKLQLV